MKKCFVFFFFCLMFAHSAGAQSIEAEIGKLFLDIDVQEIAILRQSGIERVNKIFELVEETIFEPGVASVAKAIQTKEGTIDGSFCLLNLTSKEISENVLNEYQLGTILPTDKYIVMGVTLALEKCQVIQKEDRRSLYEFYKEIMNSSVNTYSFEEWKKDMNS